MDGPQPLGRILDVGGKRCRHRADLVADVVLVGVGAGGDRDLRDQRFGRQLAALLQIFAGGTGHQRQHDVVELDTVGVLDGLGAGQLDTGSGDPAVRRNRCVEPGFGRLEEPWRPTGQTQRGGLLAHRLLHQAGDPERRLDADVDQRAHRASLDPRDLDADQRTDRFPLRRTRFRRDVEQDFTQPGPGDAVDDRVVHLGQRRDPAAFDTLDHP